MLAEIASVAGLPPVTTPMSVFLVSYTHLTPRRVAENLRLVDVSVALYPLVQCKLNVPTWMVMTTQPFVQEVMSNVENAPSTVIPAPWVETLPSTVEAHSMLAIGLA